jgi:hypothetical protein
LGDLTGLGDPALWPERSKFLNYVLPKYFVKKKMVKSDFAAKAAFI